MQVVLHTGAHFTDESRLIKSLEKSTDMLLDRGIVIPQPHRYRKQIRSRLKALSRGPLDPASRAALLSEMLDGQSPDRAVLSNSNFFCVAPEAVAGDRFYPNAAERLRLFAELFEGHDIEVMLAVRNPATFLPALAENAGTTDLDTMTDGSLPMALRWSELVMRIRTALPHVPLVVWCNEDTPLIWEELLREMAGLEPTVQFEGRNDLLVDIMSPEGMARFDAYVTERPGLTEVQKRRVIAAFLDKFAIEEELEEEFDLPGWTEELIERLTEAYDEDIYQIERIPGVTLITP